MKRQIPRKLNLKKLTNKSFFANLPRNFHAEANSLRLKGIKSWTSLKDLKNEEINEITRSSLASSRNLKRLRCIANLICELNVSPEDAALLMHSGIASIKALASLTPQELLLKTGRLERLLRTGRKPVVDLKKANSWIQIAKARQITN